ncbi:MAG TPA: inorganic phosphate transporter [Methanomassiliicoccaceae archaeon]|jgi:PiT family inorganic phosphate transporter|nr:inorganic phosphate transporter [Methanomassiliicoccaceae archaeon]HPT74024.1 inorganic phosphate transporter [Methanomassiliicoccaceae archaeon]HQD87803.1 inorganic phosphate transporter [Methanomassiliicoccaceae archaeon]
MVEIELLAAATIILALLFAFTNGVQDASSTVATMVASGVTSPRSAVFYAALLGLIGAMLGGSAVAFTMQSLVELPSGKLMGELLLAAVAGATLWNVITWRRGLPSSSTHSLIGGLVGAAAMGAGLSSVSWGADELAAGQLVGMAKIIAFLFISVATGFIGGYLLRKLSAILLRPARSTVVLNLRRLQWLTTGMLAFAHGSNDSQKQMGLMVMALMSAGLVATDDIPLWVRASCAAMMAAGTLAGGWEIMKTLGRKIYRLRPLDSLDSQLVSASSLLGSTILGAPVSSTQVVASSVMGVGAAVNARMVQWDVGRHMVASWFLTIPASATISATILSITSLLF